MSQQEKSPLWIQSPEETSRDWIHGWRFSVHVLYDTQFKTHTHTYTHTHTHTHTHIYIYIYIYIWEREISITRPQFLCPTLFNIQYTCLLMSYKQRRRTTCYTLNSTSTPPSFIHQESLVLRIRGTGAKTDTGLGDCWCYDTPSLSHILPRPYSPPLSLSYSLSPSLSEGMFPHPVTDSHCILIEVHAVINISFLAELRIVTISPLMEERFFSMLIVTGHTHTYTHTP